MSTAAQRQRSRHRQRKSRALRRLGIRRLVMLVSETQIEILIAAGVSEDAIGDPAQLSRAIAHALLNRPATGERRMAASAQPVKARRKAGYVLFIP